MWLEAGLAVLLLVALAQSFVMLQLWRHSRRLQQRVDGLWHALAQNGTDVPTSMLVTALGRLERQMGLIGQQAPQVRQAYDLAQQLAREGADVEQLVARCGLSRDEARLVLQMHPTSA